MHKVISTTKRCGIHVTLEYDEGQAPSYWVRRIHPRRGEYEAGGTETRLRRNCESSSRVAPVYGRTENNNNISSERVVGEKG